ncbi:MULTISPECIES: nSTAND1 domain-containing NTPase [unclassified Microcoleus]|uniref:nSTAND1 domain-containing NTPase n=1 Tax=unclassified Microcoleus TaxID=2642155 RepID=UPI002FD2387B
MSEIKRSLAVVIGIDRYFNNIPPLQTAANDAQQLANLIEEKYQYQVLLLLDTDATLSNISDLLAGFAEKILVFPDGHKVQVAADDRILFYFAGHGIALDGLDNAEGPAGFLIPQDGERDDSDTWLSMQRLHDSLIQLPCRHSLIILDCCFAGTFRWAAVHREAVRSQKVYRERYARYTSGCAQQVITSAAHDEKAADSLYRFGQRSESSNHSPFAELLLKALEGEADLTKDGVITATELYAYLQSEFGKIAAKQTPGFAQLKHHDKGEYIFILPGFDVNQLPPAPKLNENTNPYKGLQSFEEADSDKFFGRQALNEKLVEFVTEHPLTVVLGASGSGKSSLVKAGLLPQLKTTQPNWRILSPIRPGESPFSALNSAIENENLTEFLISNELVSDKDLPETSTRSPSLEAGQTLQSLLYKLSAWKNFNPHTKLLLVIDQFEELVTLTQDSQDQENFLNWLAKALEFLPDWLRIVITLRSDFEPQFRDTALKPYWKKSRFVVPAMTREELRQAIVDPAAAKVMYFEPATLVEQLIDEVAQMPGALPLLSFTLSELYFNYIKNVREGKRNNRAITQEDYEELGGVTRSLTQRADAEYDELLKSDRAYAKTIRHIMLRMVAVGGGELARRRVLDEELIYPEPENQRVQTAIEQFCAARLLVKGRDTEGKGYVEPAHDVLMRGWQKLIVWEREHQENLILQRRLTPAAIEWKSKEKPLNFQQKIEPLVNFIDSSLLSCQNVFYQINATLIKVGKRKPSLQKRSQEKQEEFLWDTNPYLKVLDEHLKYDENWFNEVEAEFLQRSLRRRRNNLRRKISLIATAFAVTLGFLFYQWNQNLQAQSRSLALSAEQLFSSDRELDALIEALKALKIMKQAVWVSSNTQEEVVSALQSVIYRIRESNRLKGHQAAIYNITFSPDNQTFASASADNTIKLWKSDGSLLNTLSGHTNEVYSISFSPDSQIIASASADGTVKLWKPNGTLLNTLSGHKGPVLNVSFSPDGKTLASASADKTIKLWKPDGTLLKTIQDKAPVISVSFTPDGQTIASGGADGTVKLWKLDGSLRKSFPAHKARIMSVSFSRDGEVIASSSEDKTVKIWKPDGTLVKTLEHNTYIFKVSFSPDSQLLVSSSADNIVKVWKRDGTLLNTLTGRSPSFSPDGQILAFAGIDNSIELWKFNNSLRKTLTGQTDLVLGVSFSPKNDTLASGTANSLAEVWKRDGSLLKTLSGHQAPVSSVSFSPDGQTIASGSLDSKVKLWKQDGTLLNTLSGHKAQVVSVRFSPDGQTIASGSYDTTVKLWKPDGTLLNTLSKHSGLVLSLSFSPDSKTLASASLDKTVKLWKMDGTLLNTMKHEDQVYGVSFSPNGQTLASASDDGTLKVWKKDGTLLKSWTGHRVAANSISFSPDGKILASTGNDKTVKFWKPDGTWIATLPGHTAAVRSLSFSPDGKTLASGSDDTTMILWNLEGLELDALLKHGCFWMRDYFNNPNVNLSKEDRQVCDRINRGS